MFPSIIYEDTEILVIDKPAGLIVHPKHEKDQQDSVVGWLLGDYPKLQSVGDNPLRPGIVHRLDKYTSGILVIAKTQASFDYLQGLFQNQMIKKVYLALVWGRLEKNQGRIDTPLGKVGVKQALAKSGPKELNLKEALTEFKVKRKFTDYTLLAVSPKTGRTHQIRAHLALINHPIVGDPLYGNKASLKNDLALKRPFLHSWKVEFQNLDGVGIHLESDLPADLTETLKKLEKK